MREDIVEIDFNPEDWTYETSYTEGDGLIEFYRHNYLEMPTLSFDEYPNFFRKRTIER